MSFLVWLVLRVSSYQYY